MEIKPNFLVLIVLAISIIGITEFSVRVMLYNRLFSMYPKQKYKTIKRKIITQPFFDRYIRFSFIYDNRISTIIYVVIIYLYRILGYFLACIVMFSDLPNVYSNYGYSLWIYISAIVGLIYTRGLRKRHK